MKKKSIKKSCDKDIYASIPKTVQIMKKNKMTGQYEIVDTDIPNPNWERLKSIDYKHEFDNVTDKAVLEMMINYENEYIGFDELDICGGIEDIPYRREYDDPEGWCDYGMTVADHLDCWNA